MAEATAKRIFSFIIRHYLKNYVEPVSYEQLSLSRNEGKMENVILKVEKFNEIAESYNIPLELIQGKIDLVTLTIPLHALLVKNSIIECKGLYLVFQPKGRPEDASMFDSMWGSATSSLQLAEECLHSKAEDESMIDDFQVPQGVHFLARIIETILAKMKVRLVDAVIKLENVLENSTSGIALEIRIKSAEYFDVAGVENFSSSDGNKPPSERSFFEPIPYAVKNCVLDGISFYTYQFSRPTESFSSDDYTSTSTDQWDQCHLSPGSPEMPPTHCPLSIQRTEDEVLQPEPILISKITGEQQIQLKLKQNEAITGTKVDVEFNLGNISFFLSPLQVHMLTELIQGLLKPNYVDKKNQKRYLRSATNRPMKTADFELIEQELQRQQEKPNLPSKSLKNHQGWSSHSLDDSDEEFHLMSTEDRTAPSVASATNDLDSSCSSIGSEARLAISSGQESSSGRKLPKLKGSNVQALLQDPVSDLTQFRVSCSSLCVIVLHEDVVTEAMSSDEFPFNSRTPTKSTLSLKKRAENYFEELTTLSISGLNFTDFAAMRDQISQLCQANHLRFMVSGLTIEGNEKSSSSQRLFYTSLAMLDFELLECLFDSPSDESLCPKPSYMEIISFRNKDNKFDKNNTERTEHNFTMNYEQTDCLSQQRASKQLSNKLSFHLEPVSLEIDISLTDRIRSLLHQQAMFRRKEKLEPSIFNWRDDESCNVRFAQQTKVDLTSPFVMIKLRFPVPDFRPLHDMERVPWWQQNLRKEILIMELLDASLSTTIDNEQSQKEVEVQCQDFHGLFQESPTEKPVSFLRVSVDPEADRSSRDNGFDWPRLVIHKVSENATSIFESELLSNKEEECQFSLADGLMSRLKENPSPFKSNSVIYGSKLNSNDEFSDENESKIEEVIIMPAEKEKIQNFIDEIMNKSQYVFNFCLPTANLVLPDKQFFEVLLNRLTSDLILWKNATLNPVRSLDPNGFKVHPPGFDFSTRTLKENPAFQLFSNCATDYLNDSDSDDDNGIYSSSNEYFHQLNQEKHNHVLTKISISLNVVKGSVTIHSPSRDSSLNVLPGYCGKMQLNVEDCTLFVASSYQGDPNESYICLLSNKSALHHNGTVLLPTNRPLVQTFAKSHFSNLHPIIYRSESGIPVKPGVVIGCGDDSLDMLTLVVHVVKDTKQQIKTFKVALGLCGATLRHYMAPSSKTWLNQFMDFVNVDDYPIHGYKPLPVVTEFHLQLGNCAIDYRPLHLPYRTVLTVDNFSMSSNVAAPTSTLMLRFISEELYLFISNDTKAKNVNLKTDYVCVLDTGLIDVSIVVTTNEDSLHPKMEMCATNNMIHIRTCADSCKALQKLLMYLASDGDLDPQPSSSTDAKEKRVVSEPTYSESNSSSSKMETVHNLMAEAMKDCASSRISDYSTDHENSARGFRTLYSDSDLGSTDEEFCILEDDPGVGLMPPSGEPQIRLLTNDPIRIIEKHFTVPSEKSDLLKAPKHFPKALLRYTLREMSITWHMYGGNDFTVKKNNEKKHVRINNPKKGNFNDWKNSDDEQNVSINAHKGIISFCNVTPTKANSNLSSFQYSMEHFCITPSKPNDHGCSWISRGGENRNMDVLMELQLNKVRFRHEVYPENSEYASRDVLLIHDIEIRDRLASSEINKFLYQYTSESMPRQTHSNMIVIKAVHIRSDRIQESQECSLKVSCKPLRLNIDQDALMFLYEFFGEASDITPTEDPRGQVIPDSKAPAILPVTIETTRDLISSPLSPTAPRDKETIPPTFFRSFTFSPDVFIKLDYHGKHVTMDQGALQGIFLGLTQLNSSKIELKRLSYRHGLLGLEKLFGYAVNEWMEDIKKNQLSGLLGGVGPMHSFVQLFQGIKDFVWLPIEQYRKDGQIVRGLQRGTASLSTSSVMAILDLTGRLVSAVQSGAEFAFDMVSPGLRMSYQQQRNLSSRRRSSHPVDIREGVTTAYNVVKEGLGDTARTIRHVACVEHENKGILGAVGGVAWQIFPTVVKPVILGTEATGLMLGGVKNQLVPDAHREAIDKWRTKNN